MIHCTEKPRDALYGRILARITGAKLVVHMHVKFHDGITPRAAAGIKGADRVIAISRFVRDSLVSAGVPPERVVVVPNALDPGQWRLSGERPLHLRQDLGIGRQEIMVLCASRLFAWKGHRELIRAFKLVAEVEPCAKLVVIGEDDPRAHPGGGSFRAELEDLVGSFGLDSKVQFLGFREDVPALMQAADIFAMPSFEEPFGMVFVEAMALERPVVALANGGTLDVVQHGKTGLLSEPGDIRGLADNLLALIRDPRLRATLGRQGRQQVDDLFNAKRLAADVEGLYREVLGIGR